MTAHADRFGFVTRATQRGSSKNELPPSKVEGTTATIRLYDVIDSWGGYWGVSATEFAEVLDGLPADVTEIRLHINSPGGEVWEGLAILNMLRQHSARVVVMVDAFAASAASVIAMAGDEVVMARNSEMMIHDAMNICVGNAAKMSQMVARLNRESDNIASIYAEKAGGTAEQWRTAMKAETWYSAEEAVAAGLADRVDEQATSEQPTDRYDLSAVFAYAGRSKAPAPAALAAPRPPSASAAGSIHTREGSPAVAFTDEQLTNLRQLAGVAEDADEGTILAALDEAIGETAPTNTGSGTTSTATLPEGVVAIDAEQLAQLRSQAADGAEARQQQRVAERDSAIDQAIDRGAIPRARAEHYRKSWDADPEGTRATLDSLESGLVPLKAAGHDAGASDAAAASEDDVRESPVYKNWSM